MAKALNITIFKKKPKKNNKGIHAKTKQSKAKGSSNYAKVYRGQGK